MKPFLIRANYVEAGLLDFLKKAVKKSVMVLIASGLFTSIAEGRSISKSGAEKSAKVFNETVAETGVSVAIKVDLGSTKDSGTLTYIFKHKDGSKAVIRLVQTKSTAALDAKQYKPIDGEMNELVTYTAKMYVDELQKDIKGEGITFKK